MTDTGHDPFAVDVDAALSALSLAWQDEYDELGWAGDTGWYAHHKDAPEGEVIRASVPDELNRAIRDDWARRQGQQQ